MDGVAITAGGLLHLDGLALEAQSDPANSKSAPATLSDLKQPARAHHNRVDGPYPEPSQGY